MVDVREVACGGCEGDEPEQTKATEGVKDLVKGCVSAAGQSGKSEVGLGQD